MLNILKTFIESDDVTKNHRQEVLYSTFDLGNREFNCKVSLQFYKKKVVLKNEDAAVLFKELTRKQ